MIGMPFGMEWMPGACVQLAVAAAMFALLYPRFARAAWGALRDRCGNLDLIVSLGTGSALLLALWNLWRQGTEHAHRATAEPGRQRARGGGGVADRARLDSAAPLRSAMHLDGAMLAGDSVAAAESAMKQLGVARSWAFAFNLAGLPLAAPGLLSPAIAGAAMAMSSVAAVTSALRLWRWRP